jgi:outer membrane protein assembly factor BamB
MANRLLLEFRWILLCSDIHTGKQKWKFKTGGENDRRNLVTGYETVDMQMDDLCDYFLSSPVVDLNNKELTLYFGSSDGNLYALDATDGSEMEIQNEWDHSFKSVAEQWHRYIGRGQLFLRD